jgi:Protein kinase domain
VQRWPTLAEPVSSASAAQQFPELVLGRYRPLKPLGSGGSGSVWLARDEQSGLDVALKIVAREGKAAARAEREAAAAARLRHPRCIRAYAFARDARHVYIAYEYVPGQTFREALRAGELDDRRAIEAGAQICEGLAHAHAAGIVHRDVKPSNVLLAAGHDVSIRLLDFGLAQMHEAETLTAQGDVPGTLAYIAPERLGGIQASEASDVWAVGVMLWEALAGRHPFWNGSMLETARAIEAGAPPLAELRPDLPKALLALVDRALDLDPRRRPTALHVAHALRDARPKRRVAKPRGRSVALAAPLQRLAAAGLAGTFAGWTSLALPFFPSGWWLGLGALAAASAYARERIGLAVALAVPVLPLGNVSLGLALLYGIVAVGWFAAAWREPRAGLFAALGPLFGPLHALGLLPLAAAAVRSPFRRALQAATAVLLATLAAGFRHAPLPFTGARPPRGLGIAGANGPLDVAGSLLRALGDHPALLIEASALAVVAALLPYARARGRWGVAGISGLLLAATLLPVPSAAALPLVLAAWLTWAALTLASRAAT